MSLSRPLNSSSRPARSRVRAGRASPRQAPETSNEGSASIFRWWSTRTTRRPKTFLEREAQKLAPGLKRKSGARYRLNRWREEQLIKGVKLTYEGLVKEYVRLNQTREPFAQIPHDRYINFMSDFLAAEKGATREQAIRAWKKLKTLDVPKNYRSWVKSNRRHRGDQRRGRPSNA